MLEDVTTGLLVTVGTVVEVAGAALEDTTTGGGDEEVDVFVVEVVGAVLEDTTTAGGDVEVDVFVLDTTVPAQPNSAPKQHGGKGQFRIQI